MFGILALLFVVIPLADLTLLLILASYIGWQISLALAIGSGILGAWLAKISYHSAVRKFQTGTWREGGMLELFSDGVMIFFAAALLLTPGFITDTFGFTLLIPACRKWYRKRMANWVRTHTKVHYTQFSTKKFADRDEIVEGEVERRDRRSPDRPAGIEGSQSVE
jgi:UPF0716 protein FxsA